jgi:NADH:ubiquinone oxidoreductase subunit C
MNKEELKNKLAETFPNATLSENKQFLILAAPSANIVDTAFVLKNNTELLFDFMFCVTGEDWTTHFIITYHLRSTKNGQELVLKAKIENRNKPEIETLSHLFSTAELNEREIFEMYGINFLHHPDMRKLLLPEDWEGYPMRKDYYDPIHVVELE